MLRNTILTITVGLGVAGCTVVAQPLTETELALNAEDKLSRVTSNQEPVSQSISLYEAMARALKYNLDYRLEIYSRQLANEKLNVARFDMLPSLVANADKANRKTFPYSTSRTLAGITSVDPSTSRERQTLTKDLSFSWNILDFGLSYVRAKQAADRALIAEEQKRKVINRIIEDVRTAYWRAVSAERLLSGFQRLEGKVQRALNNSRALRAQGHTSPISALTFERELVEIKKQAQTLQREMRTSKIQLAALMNLRPEDKFKIVIPKRKMKSLNLTIPANEMAALALQNRPELREIAYQGRISELEAKAALLELLPGLQFYAGANYDSNAFLLNNDWVNWGAKASWNVMRLFQYPARKALVEAEIGLSDQRSLAMAMAIMTQVQVARVRYDYLRKSAYTSAQYLDVQNRILRQVKASANAQAASGQSLIREEMNALIASAEYDIAYADLQNAFAAIYASIGVDPYGDFLDADASVNDLANALRETWAQRGDVAG